MSNAVYNTTPFRQTFEGSKTYFLGCPHWGHSNIIKGISTWPSGGLRDYSSIHEMNVAITQSIIENVPYDGNLFLLGDIIFGNKDSIIPIITQLVPRNIFCVYGNHDSHIRKNTNYQKLFQWCGNYLEIYCTRKIGKKKLCCLFHYPMKVWCESHRLSYALTSHSHGSLPYKEDELGLDCGWDVWRKPISFYEVDDILSKRKFRSKDHHNSSTT